MCSVKKAERIGILFGVETPGNILFYGGPDVPSDMAVATEAIFLVPLLIFVFQQEAKVIWQSPN